MSSEALPLIFEPLEDSVSERAPPDRLSAGTLVPGSLRPPVDGDGPSRAPTPLTPDRTSGTEQLELDSSVPPQQAGGELDYQFNSIQFN